MNMKKIFDIKIEQSDDIELKGTSEGDLLVSVNSGGQFAGERLSGRVMPVGCSTSYSPESGLNRIYESVLLETDDGARIFMKIDAYLQLPQELEDRFLAGEAVPVDEYYYKGSVCFNAGDSRCKWLENRVFMCDGIIEDWSSLRFAVYEV